MADPAPQSDTPPRPADALSLLLQLEREMRRVESHTELGYIIVNESRRLLTYRQAILWSLSPGGRPRPLAVSGVGDFDPNAPLFTWLTRLLKAAPGHAALRQFHRLSATEAPERFRDQWREWLPEHLLWVPLPPPRGAAPAALLLARDTPWEETESQLAGLLAESFGFAWLALTAPPPGGRWWQRLGYRWRWGIPLAAVALLAAWPVQLSVLAPARVAASRPLVVSAPLDGVVEGFQVRPNQEVTAGTPLFRLDDTVLKNRHHIALKALEVEKAALERSTRKGFHDDRSMAETALLKAQVALKQAEVEYTADMLSRVAVTAEADGVAIFSDVNDWVGRPVKLGEKVLYLADPNRVEVEVWLPVDDALILEPGAEMLLFLNVRPTDPLPATLQHTSYEAQSSPEGVLAFRLKGRFETGGTDAPPPRIGLKGTAKLYGARVSLLYTLVRRPLAALRQWVGW